jgi:hypothetical protein
LEGGINIYVYTFNNPIAFIDHLGLSWLDWKGFDYLDYVGNFSAGFGDTITSGFGLTHLFGVRSFTEWARSLTDANQAVDPCSGSYSAGKWGAYAWLTATTWVGGLNGGSNSVFWAGRGSSTIAEGLGTTIGKTPIGAVLDAIGVENRIIWRIASATFAGNVRGSAIAVIRYVAQDSIWLMERAILNWRNIPIIFY